MKCWVLNLEDSTLLSDKQDSLSISPKATKILTFLISHNGSVVSRNDILNEVWQGRQTNPDLVREYIFEIRKALGDSAKESRYVETVGRRGFRVIGPISVSPHSMVFASREEKEKSKSRYEHVDLPPVRFCSSKDGTSIAHTTSGKGTPLLIAGSWMTHLDLDWQSPAYGDYIKHLSSRFHVIRYDQRGNGLSQLSNVDIHFEGMVDDMETVINSYGYDKVAILGISQGASVSLAYAHRYPDRVSHLVLNGGYARGRRQRGNSADQEESEALVSLIRNSWANKNPAIRQVLTSLLMPEASQEQMRWFNDFQKSCGPAENIARFRVLFDEINVVSILDKITVPTLVLHSDGDSVAPFSEGKLLATKIAQASFVPLNSLNHMLFEREPDFNRMMEKIENFVSR